ncbi:HD-GYP domain-containing protein [Ammoniphilus sp. CFH 90114]|uniref:HD-GYP domain-containing protein n=1 Tax=Ammoniphilus sp. CFH 90114 TaxID=2493665 RepID=UPI00100E70C1|nr:HD domain-containing phosphohydrolase [Ammoniphilus sp. CFH 90114]RXT15399.1 HD domain-containing protein [Ammoniphilus sp. CFH 90114]
MIQLSHTILSQGQSLETVYHKNLTLSLLASHQGKEVIHHTLKEGAYWFLYPEEGWNGLEFLYILRGTLIKQGEQGDEILEPGSSISFCPVTEYSIFIAQTEVEFIYVSTLPVFHLYSLDLIELMDMAIKTEEKDGYTSEHCHRIRNNSNLIGRALGLPPNRLFNLAFGAFFHDIGKLKIPETILRKTTKMTQEEWEILKSHAVHGAEILRNSGIPYLSGAALIVEQHHERYDGSGYPCGLKQDEILIEAQIVAVMDSFDAMTTDRPYNLRRKKEEAIYEIVRYRGTLYHPAVVDAFLSIVDQLET